MNKMLNRMGTEQVDDFFRKEDSRDRTLVIYIIYLCMSLNNY